MLVAAAVCPHPPLLVPEVASGAARELDDLRAACDEAVHRLLSENPDRVVIVGGGPRTTAFPRGASGTLAPYGVDVVVGASDAPELPLSLTIGDWLAGRAGWSGSAQMHAVDAGLPPDGCAALGVELAGKAPRVATLVMGDGSARRSPRAPGALDERAADFDARVAKALGSGDAAGLIGIDADLAAALMAAGRAAWQVLAGAAADGSYDAELLYDDAPYGVGYFVASWRRR